MYKIGDKIEILIGAIGWIQKEDESKPKFIDIRSDLIGEKGTLLYTYDTKYRSDAIKENAKWCIDTDKYGKISWFQEKQFKLVENE